MPAASREPGASVHIALLTVQASFSGLHVAGKIVLETLDPLALAALRVLFATPLLFLLATRHGTVRPPRDLWPRLVLLGATGVFINQILFITGLRLTRATDAAVLMPSIPVFAAGLAFLFGLERIGRRRIAGIVLAVLGALALVAPRGELGHGSSIVGNALILANCLSYAGFLVLQRPVLARLQWRAVLAWAFLIGGSGVVVIGAPALAAFEPATLGRPEWMSLAYILVFPTALGYSLATWAVRRSSATLVATYTTLQPMLTAAMAWPLLGEVPGWREAAGFVAIGSGLWLVSRSSAARGDSPGAPVSG